MKSTLFAAAMILATGTAYAGNAEQLLADNCSSCHGSEVYSRADHRVSSLQGLEAQVRRCDANLGTRWFDEDIDAVVNYLNTQYYQFQ